MENYKELYEWVDTHPLTRQKRYINRDFSDAIPLVEILTHHFPKLIEPHNYMPRNSFALKLINWQTLNNKVLKKLKLKLTNNRIEQLAKGVPGVIEQLLLELREKIETMKNANEDPNNMTINPEFERNVETKSIPLEVWDKMENDLKEKDETITLLQNNVEHLTNLINNKDERIRELTEQIEALLTDHAKTVDKLDKNDNNRDNSRFFGLFG